jgi:DNA-binding response OmpR family regulator
VVVLSAKSAERDVTRALELGANAYLTKPFDPDELIEVIGRVLSSTPAQLDEERNRLLARVAGSARG